MSLSKALEFTLRWEGGYANHPADHGGPTNRGITQATYDAYLKSIGAQPHSVKEIHDEEVEAIYRVNYWNSCRCDEVPWPLSLAVFDCAVNSGPRQSVRLLQQAAGNLIIDGVIGPKTIAACQALPASKVVDQREDFVRRIVEHDPTQQVFLRGWLSRLAALRRVAIEAK